MDERFFTFMLRVSRLSDAADILPITLSERLLEERSLEAGDALALRGQLRSYNQLTDNKMHLVLTVFAKELLDNETAATQNPNEIYINGYLCKPPIYRKTPFGREITDMIVAVNRAFNRSDYIPAIAWGRNAVFCDHLSVGSNIAVWGRLQSRRYLKRISETESETRVAYELSVSRIEKIA